MRKIFQLFKNKKFFDKFINSALSDLRDQIGVTTNIFVEKQENMNYAPYELLSLKKLVEIKDWRSNTIFLNIEYYTMPITPLVIMCNEENVFNAFIKILTHGFSVVERRLERTIYETDQVIDQKLGYQGQEIKEFLGQKPKIITEPPEHNFNGNGLPESEEAAVETRPTKRLKKIK